MNLILDNLYLIYSISTVFVSIFCILLVILWLVDEFKNPKQ